MPLVHVVDDDSSALRSICEALARAGYGVFAHRGLASYLDFAIERAPDLIVADVLSAQADAMEYLSALRARPELAAAPVVIMSSLNVRDGVRVDQLLKDRFGVCALVRKPCAAPALLDVVRRALFPADDPAVHQPSDVVASSINKAMSELEIETPAPAREPIPLAAIPLRQMAAHPTAESRTERRFEASFEVTFANRDEFMREYTQNISRGGLFVRTNSPPPQHSTVTLTLRLPDEAEPLEVLVNVAHTTLPGSGAPSGFGARLTEAGRAELERWHRLVEGVERRAPTRMRGPRVLLLGFSNDRAADLARNAGLLCRQEVSLVPMQSWQSVLYEARRIEDKKKLLIVDVSQAPAERRRELFDPRAMRELSSISNLSLAFVGLMTEDEPNLPTDQHVIRAGTLTTADLVGAIVTWLELPSRHELRVPISGTIRLEHVGVLGEGTLLDISMSGLRFLCDKTFESGQELFMSFAVPAHQKNVQSLHAEVRWAKPEGRGKCMVGVHFSLENDHPARETIKHYIDQQALLLRSLEGLRKEATSGGITEERVRKIVPLDD